MPIKLYHNPRCSKSRATLKLIEDNADEKPIIIEYLKTPPTKPELVNIVKWLGITPRELLRTSEDEYKALNLADDSVSDEAILEAMVSHPKLIQRPIVVTEKGVCIGRPPENVLKIL